LCAGRGRALVVQARDAMELELLDRNRDGAALFAEPAGGLEKPLVKDRILEPRRALGRMPGDDGILARPGQGHVKEALRLVGELLLDRREDPVVGLVLGRLLAAASDVVD